MKGQQRLIAFQFAADSGGAALDSNVEITIQASFDPLAPNVLGSAGAAFSIRDLNDSRAAAGFPAQREHELSHRAGRQAAGTDWLVDAAERCRDDSFWKSSRAVQQRLRFLPRARQQPRARSRSRRRAPARVRHGLGFRALSRTTGNTWAAPRIRSSTTRLTHSTNTPFPGSPGAAAPQSGWPRSRRWTRSWTVDERRPRACRRRCCSGVPSSTRQRVRASTAAAMALRRVRRRRFQPAGITGAGSWWRRMASARRPTRASR